MVAGEKVLSADAGAELEALLAPAKWDLALNPGRYASWTLLMGAYNQAAGTLVVRGLEKKQQEPSCWLWPGPRAALPSRVY